MREHILPVLLGATADAYALAATFYEDFGIRALVLDTAPPELFYRSRAVCARAVPYLTEGRIFLRALCDLYEGEEERQLLLVPMKEPYALLTATYESELSSRYLLPGGCSVPPEFCDDAPISSPDALLFCYIGKQGSARLTYAEVVGRKKDGAPLALATHPTPDGLDELITSLALPRGFFVLALRDEDGEAVIAPLSSPFSYLRFPLAADHSLPEFILREYILCEPLPEAAETPEGLFLITDGGSFRIPAEELPRARALCRAHLVVHSYPARAEGRALRTRLAHRRLMRALSRA